MQETCLYFIEESYNEVLASAGFEDLDKEEIIKIIRLGNDPKKRKRQKGSKWAEYELNGASLRWIITLNHLLT